MRIHKHAPLAYLLVKIVSLADESRLIRRYERTYKHEAAPGRHVQASTREDGAGVATLDSNRYAEAREAWLGLASHRRGTVRQEARASLLAYGYLRGTPYKRMESVCHTSPDWERVVSLLRKYGGAAYAGKGALEAWYKAPVPSELRAAAE